MIDEIESFFPSIVGGNLQVQKFIRKLKTLSNEEFFTTIFEYDKLKEFGQNLKQEIEIIRNIPVHVNVK